MTYKNCCRAWDETASDAVFSPNHLKVPKMLRLMWTIRHAHALQRKNIPHRIVEENKKKDLFWQDYSQKERKDGTARVLKSDLSCYDQSDPKSDEREWRTTDLQTGRPGRNGVEYKPVFPATDASAAKLCKFCKVCILEASPASTELSRLSLLLHPTSSCTWANGNTGSLIIVRVYCFWILNDEVSWKFRFVLCLVSLFWWMEVEMTPNYIKLGKDRFQTPHNPNNQTSSETTPGFFTRGDFSSKSSKRISNIQLTIIKNVWLWNNITINTKCTISKNGNHCLGCLKPTMRNNNVQNKMPVLCCTKNNAFVPSPFEWHFMSDL